MEPEVECQMSAGRSGKEVNDPAEGKEGKRMTANRKVDRVRQSKASDCDLNISYAVRQTKSPTDQSPADKEPSPEGATHGTHERRRRGERRDLVVISIFADPEEVPSAVN